MNSSNLPTLNRQILQNLLQEIEKDFGESALENILEQFYKAMHDDVMIGFFFTGKDLAKIARHQAYFMKKAAALVHTLPPAAQAEALAVKAPAQAHTELPPILTGFFDRRIVILKEVLTKQGLNPGLIKTWLDFEESFREQVVSS